MFYLLYVITAMVNLLKIQASMVCEEKVALLRERGEDDGSSKERSSRPKGTAAKSSKEDDGSSKERSSRPKRAAAKSDEYVVESDDSDDETVQEPEVLREADDDEEYRPEKTDAADDTDEYESTSSDEAPRNKMKRKYLLSR